MPLWFCFWFSFLLIHPRPSFPHLHPHLFAWSVPKILIGFCFSIFIRPMKHQVLFLLKLPWTYPLIYFSHTQFCISSKHALIWRRVFFSWPTCRLPKFRSQLLVPNLPKFSYLPFPTANLLPFRVHPIYPKCQDRRNLQCSYHCKFQVQRHISIPQE